MISAATIVVNALMPDRHCLTIHNPLFTNRTILGLIGVSSRPRKDPNGVHGRSSETPISYCLLRKSKTACRSTRRSDSSLGEYRFVFLVNFRPPVEGKLQVDRARFVTGSKC